MTRLAAFLTGLAAALALGTAYGAATKADQRVEAAIEVLQQFKAMPERGIPKTLLNSAYGVAVLPNVIKAGFIIGARHGKGVLVVRKPDGRWGKQSREYLAKLQ